MKQTRKLEKYADYLFQKELSEGTIRIYVRQASLLLEYLDGKPITKTEIIGYKKYLLSQNKKMTTVNLYLVAVNSYLKYAGYGNCTVKTERLQRSRCLENVINMEEYRHMLSYAKESGRFKYYYIIRVLVFTGITGGGTERLLQNGRNRKRGDFQGKPPKGHKQDCRL